MSSKIESVRRAWVDAVLEGRWATAAYLAPDLPVLDPDEGIVRVPVDARETFAVKGEIDDH